MSRRDNWMCSIGSLVSIHLFAVAVAALAVSPAAVAGTFNWGDLSDPAGDVMYLDIEENNSEANALFAPDPVGGAPAPGKRPEVVGNRLFLDPQTFQSQSSGGSANLLDSTLTTVVMAKPGQSIDNVLIEEFGDYTLTGLPDSLAQATVGLAWFLTVLEVDGAPVVDLQDSGVGTFTDGGIFNRPPNEGSDVWSGSALIDVAGFLADENVDGNATKVRIRFDNTLSTAADSVSNAFIKKKEGGVIITTNIPEPSSVVLGVIAALGLAWSYRRLG